jgi:hypothetical protein
MVGFWIVSTAPFLPPLSFTISPWLFYDKTFTAEHAEKLQGGNISPPFEIIAKWQVKRKNGVGEKLIGFMTDNLQVLIDEMF